ncbi:MAG: hypothetical protein WC788_02720, partial [Candidatus Paceibacterota bacterium]
HTHISYYMQSLYNSIGENGMGGNSSLCVLKDNTGSSCRTFKYRDIGLIIRKYEKKIQSEKNFHIIK